jgi:hypothetical protein
VYGVLPASACSVSGEKKVHAPLCVVNSAGAPTQSAVVGGDDGAATYVGGVDEPPAYTPP